MEGDFIMNRDYTTGLTTLGAALSCETRVKMLLAVVKEPMAIGELARLLGIAQSTCSHHVEALTRVNLLEMVAEGSRHVVHPVAKEIRIALRAA